MSEQYRDYTEIPTPKVTPEELLTRKKHRILDTVAKVVTLFIAFLFWLYVFATNDATKVEEKRFEVVPVEVRGTETMSSRGLAVQDMSFFNLDVTLKGTRSALSGVKMEDITAYIDISDITERGVYTRAVRFSIPSGVALSDSVATAEVEITVDTVAIKTFVVDATNVYLGNFSLPESCTIDSENILLGIDYVKLEAPTMLLDRIAGVRVRSTEHLTLATNTTLSAVVEAIDAAGEVVTASGLKITTSMKGIVSTDFTITVPIVQEKLLPIVISEMDSLVLAKDITVSPAYALVKGRPETMESMTKITLAAFSAKNLTTDGSGKASFTVSLGTLPQGVLAITSQDGTPFANNEVTVSVNLAKEKTLTVPKSYITVLGKSAEVVEDTVTLTVRSRTDDTDYALLQNAIAEGKEGVELYINLEDQTLSGDTSAEVTVRFVSEFADKLYIVYPDGEPYTVTVRATNP